MASDQLLRSNARPVDFTDVTSLLVKVKLIEYEQSRVCTLFKKQISRTFPNLRSFHSQDVNSSYCLPHVSYFLLEFKRFPELSRTSNLFPAFQDFPVLQNVATIFQDFPGFPGPARTLVHSFWKYRASFYTYITKYMQGEVHHF